MSLLKKIRFILTFNQVKRLLIGYPDLSHTEDTFCKAKILITVPNA